MDCRRGRSRPFPALLLLLLLCLAFAWRTAATQTFGFRVYDQQQGLTNLDINGIAAGEDGRFWLATQYGLFVFDGARFARVPSVEAAGFPYISALYMDAEQRLWFTDSDGIFYRDAAGVHTLPERSLHYGLTLAPQITALSGDLQTVYFTGVQTLLRAVSRDGGHSWQVEDAFTKRQFAEHPELNDIRSVSAHGDELWMGCGHAVCQFVHGQVRVWGELDGVPPDAWTAIFTDHSGAHWIRGAQHISVLDLGARRFRSEQNGIPDQDLDLRAPRLVEDHSGHIITNLADGLAMHSAGGWRRITTGNGLPGWTINGLFVDAQGTIWFTESGHGLMRWLGSLDWEGWTSNNGLTSNTVWALLRDARQNLWIGTESNIELLRPGSDRIEPVRTAAGRSIPQIQTMLFAPDGRLWSGSNNGDVIALDPKTRKAVTVTSQKGVFRLFDDHAGRIWICAINGIFYASSSAAKPVALPADGPFAKKQVSAVAQDKAGNLWFLTDDAVLRYDGRQWMRIPLPGNDKVSFDAELAIAPDGTFWTDAADLGLLHMRFDGSRFQLLDRGSILPNASQNVILLHFDQRGWLWVGADDGVSIYDGSRWRRISTEDGLIWNDTDTNAFLDDRDGSVWIGTSGGVAHILHPERIFEDVPLRIALSNARLGDVPLPASTGLHWKNQPLTLHLFVSDFTRIASIEYRYRLKGLETEWTRTASPEIRYPSLPAGKYTFEAVALDLDRGIRTTPVTLDFHILAPWWQQEWFYLLLGAAGLALMILVWRYSNWLLLQRQRHLETLVQTRTQELARLAIHDSLTGLLNRAAIFERLEEERHRAQREGLELAVVLADLDHFKEVNDRYGHLTGDATLAALSRMMREFLRPYDSLGRYGGEEMLILIPDIRREEATERVEQLRTVLAAETFEANGFSLHITCSFGIAMLSPADTSVSQIVERADTALYRAKNNGRNQVVCEETMDEGVGNRV